MSTDALVIDFVEAALSDSRRAEEMLASYPEIAGADLSSALVLDDLEHVRRALDETPGAVRAPGGPRRWEPLLYVCFSQFANGKSSRAGQLIAAGLNNNPALALALLEAGARPNDSESLYHSTEHNDKACLKLLLEHGAEPAGSNALKHILDREHLDCQRLLLAAGATIPAQD
jgi:hypothetical protein